MDATDEELDRAVLSVANWRWLAPGGVPGPKGLDTWDSHPRVRAPRADRTSRPS